MTVTDAPKKNSTTPDVVDFGYRSITFRHKPWALRIPLREVTVCVAMGVISVIVGLIALSTGDYPLSLSEVIGALFGSADSGFARIVVVEWRLPRVLAGIIFGGALGAAGAVFQSLTRNPLASPDIIGFSTGAYTGALIVIIVLHGTYLQQAGGALLGGIATAILVYLLAWRNGVQGFRLIIVGIAVSAILSSVNIWLMLTADLDTAMSAAAWGAGSLNGITWEQAGTGSVIIVLLLLALSALAPSMQQMELGDDAAKATGSNVEHVRLAAMVLGVALTATVTAAAGPISFVSLAAPQIARRLARTPGVTMWPAVFAGGLLLVVADFLAQHLLPSPLPVGVVTVIVGGAYLVWLIIHEVRRR